MSGSHGSFTRTLRFLGRAVEGSLAEHPEPARLLAYHRGELPTEEAAAVQEHLAWCRRDAELLRELVETFDAKLEADPEAEAETAAAWQRLRRSLPAAAMATRGGESSEKPEPLPGEDPAPAPGATRSPWVWSLAASLLVASFASGWAVLEHQRRLTGERPRVNVPIVDVDPPASQRAADSSSVEVVLAPDRDRLILVLNPSTWPDAEAYELRLVDASGRSRFQTEGLEPSPFGNFTLELSRGFLEPGLYQVEIYGGDGRTLLDRYPLRVSEGVSSGETSLID